MEYDFDAIEEKVGALKKALARARRLVHLGETSRSALASTSSGDTARSLQQSYERIAAANRRIIRVSERAVERLSAESQNMQHVDQATANRFVD